MQLLIRQPQKTGCYREALSGMNVCVMKSKRVVEKKVSFSGSDKLFAAQKDVKVGILVIL